MGFATILMISAILPVFAAQQTLPDRHSLYYVYTALSKAVNAPGIFEFTAMGLLDDRKIDYYNSEDKVKVPKQNWMKEKLPADYWEKGTQSRRSKEQWFKVNVNILMERMKQNGSDIHVLMWKHGCEVDKMADGSFKFHRGVDAYSYDGVDFLSFDDNSMQWVAPVSEAVPTKQKWDGVPILNQYTKGYLEKECVDWLNKFRNYGAKELRQQTQASPPEVTLFAKPKITCVDKLTLTCMATGFYPKDIYMSILKGDKVVRQGDSSQVMPNGDGTHQIKLSLEAKREELDAYRCELNHIALKEKLIRSWPTDGFICEDDSFPTGIVVGVIVAVILCLIITGLAFAVKKGVIGKKPVPPPTPDTASLTGKATVNGDCDSDSGKGSGSSGSSESPNGSLNGSRSLAQSKDVGIDMNAEAIVASGQPETERLQDNGEAAVKVASEQPETEHLLDNGAVTGNNTQDPTQD